MLYLQQLHRIYFFSIFCLSIVIGIQIVAIPWLALDYLDLSPRYVGLIQAAVLIPNVLLLIFGGISADRGGLSNKFLLLLFIYGLAHSFLLLLLIKTWVSFLYLLVYALILGAVSAFIQPYKDHLASLLAEGNLQNVISKNNLSQYLGQALGVGLASQLYHWQLLSLPLIQITLLLIAGLTFFHLTKKHAFNSLEHKSSDDIGEISYSLLFSGFLFCWRSMTLRSLIAIVAVSGFFHIGVFIVALPILAKKVYMGGITLYSLMQCLFMLGMIVVTIAVIIRGPLEGAGRRVIFCMLYAGLILLSLSTEPTQYGLLFLIFLWGVVVGISATLGRTVLLSQPLGEFRGRAISIYQLALFGCAPLGSLFAGFAIDMLGVLSVLKISAMISFIAFGATFLTRALWDVNTENTQSIK